MRLAAIAPAPVLALALLLPLAACDKGPSVSAQNATAEDVREKIAAAGGDGVMVNPGRWEGALTIHEIDMPGLPPAAKAKMQERMGAARNFVSCVTPEQVKQNKAFFTGDAADKSCKYDHFTMSGGKIDAVMNCDRGNGAKVAMTMTGNYAPEAYKMDMASRAKGAGPMGTMSMKATVEARRVGACRGTRDES